MSSSDSDGGGLSACISAAASSTVGGAAHARGGPGGSDSEHSFDLDEPRRPSVAADKESDPDVDADLDVAEAPGKTRGPRRLARPDAEDQTARVAAHAWRVVSAADPKGLPQGRTVSINYCSDCSGVDAPLFGLKQVKEEGRKHGVTVDLKCLFQSEYCNAGAVRFLAANHKPEVMYDDMHQRTACGGMTCLGTRASLPPPYTVDLYTAGTDCTDISLANHSHEPIVLEWSAFAEGGKSTRTLLTSLRTILALKARAFLLENVKTLDIQALMAFIKRHLPGYVLIAVRGNAADFDCRSDRDRWMVLAVRQEAARIHPAQWPALLDSCRVARGFDDARDHLLAADSPELLAEAARLQSMKLKGKVDASEEGPPKTAQQRYTALRARASAQRASATIPQMKWKEAHRRASEALRKLEVTHELPLTVSPPDPCIHDEDTDWHGLLCPRHAELADLCARWVTLETQREGQRDHREEEYYLFDIEAPCAHSRILYPSLTPVLLRRHLVALVLQRRGHRATFLRPLLGLEHLFYIGLPKNIDTSGISDVSLRALAGGTMAVPELACLFTVLLAAVDFEVELKADPPAVTDEDHIVTYITPHPCSPTASKVKRFFPGGGLPTRVPRSNYLTVWDLPTVPPQLSSPATPVLGDGPARVTAAALAAPLIEAWGRDLEIRSVFCPARNGLRSLRMLNIGFRKKGLGCIDLERPPATGQGTCGTNTPATKTVLSKVQGLMAALVKVIGCSPCWSEVRLAVVAPGEPLHLWGDEAACSADVVALPVAASDDPGRLGLWWRGAVESDTFGEGRLMPASLGPFFFDIMRIACNRSGKQTPLLTAGTSLPGCYVSSAETLFLTPGQMACFRPDVTSLLCFCFRGLDVQLYGLPTLVKAGMATQATRHFAQPAVLKEEGQTRGRRRPAGPAQKRRCLERQHRLQHSDDNAKDRRAVRGVGVSADSGGAVVGQTHQTSLSESRASRRSAAQVDGPRSIASVWPKLNLAPSRSNSPTIVEEPRELSKESKDPPEDVLDGLVAHAGSLQQPPRQDVVMGGSGAASDSDSSSDCVTRCVAGAGA